MPDQEKTALMRWTLGRLCELAGVGATVRGDAEITGLAYDSRKTAPGDLFCCIPGGRTDGHEHAAAARDAGAAALLVERFVDVPLPQGRVADVRRAIGPLAAELYGHPSRDMRVAGVTGTNGKTTVTYLVESMAEAAGYAAGVMGTVETRVRDEAVPAVRTTPEAVDVQRTLARMRDAGAEIVAMEVTSHGLHQARVGGTSFTCVAFTNLSQDHLDYHSTLEDYFAAKALLFDATYTRRAVVNTADPYGRKLVDRCSALELITFGGDGADIRCLDAELGTNGTRARLATPSGEMTLWTPLVGDFNVENLMCATGLAIHLGLGREAVAVGAERLPGVPGRLERVDAGQPFAVLVDYAHTPEALERALAACRRLTAGRLIVVFGCGGDRDRAKRPLMGSVAGRAADVLVVTSDNPRSEDPLVIIDEILQGLRDAGGTYTVIPDRREAIAAAIGEAGPDDVVLIAGKGHETGQTFADRTIPFDDRTVARELLEDLCRS